MNKAEKLEYWKEWLGRKEAALGDETRKMDEREALYRGEVREIAPLMTSGILAAHNAAFDLGVLSRCLMDYEMNDPRFVPLMDSCFLVKLLLLSIM